MGRTERGPTQELAFEGGAGNRLAGVLHLPPETDVRGGILLAHCFTCGKDLATMTRLAKGLSSAGYAVARFDFTGLGESGGEFSDTTISTSIDDLVAAAAQLTDRGYEPLGLVGHSYGGTAALLAAAHVPDVRAVAVLGSPSTPGHIARLLEERDGGHQVTVNGRTFPLHADFVADLRRQDLTEALAGLPCPLLVLHAVDDTVVPVSEGEALFAAARQPKAFVPLLEGDHLLAPPRCTAHAVDVLVDWFDRTLADGGDGRPAAAAGAPSGPA